MTIVSIAARPQSDTPRVPAALARTAAPTLLAHLLALGADREGGVVASVAELAAALGKTDRTVQRATVALRRAGLLVADERPGAPSRYVARA